MVGAFLEAGGALFLGAGGGDDAGAVEFGDLEGGHADAAGGAVDQHPVAFLHAAFLQQRVVGGVVGAAEHRGLGEREAGGNQVAARRLGVGQGAEGAGAMARHHLIARLEAIDAGADRDHFPGRLAARDERRLRPELIFAGEHQHVDILGAAGGEADLDFALGRRRRVRQVTPCQHLGATERLADHRLHAVALIAGAGDPDG